MRDVIVISDDDDDKKSDGEGKLYLNYHYVNWLDSLPDIKSLFETTWCDADRSKMKSLVFTICNLVKANLSCFFVKDEIDF
jgi:hypothetical protein